ERRTGVLHAKHRSPSTPSPTRTYGRIRPTARLLVPAVPLEIGITGVHMSSMNASDAPEPATIDATFDTRNVPRIGRSVSLDHAAQILGVSRRTIYNRIREGRLQTIRTLGGSQRVLLDSVQDI